MPGSYSMKWVRALAMMLWALVMALELELEPEMESCCRCKMALGKHFPEMHTTARRVAGHTKRTHHNHRWGYKLLELLWLQVM